MPRVVLVGCGAMSKTWLEAARAVDKLSIVGLVDVDLSRAQARAAEFRLDAAVVGDSLEAVLQETRPDAVFDIVVPAARSQVALTAIDHGCHVLTEKPLAATMDEARAIIAAAQHAKRIHAVVQNRRYIAPLRRIRRLLKTGVIGRPTSIHAEFFLPPHFGGFREEMDHVLLLDMAIHTFDAARAMTGLEALHVYCREWEPRNSWYHQGSSAAAIFEMSEGALFTYRGSWCADGMKTSWESSWRIVGERGSVTWDGFDNINAEVADATERDGLFSRTRAVEIPPLDTADAIGGHLGVMRQFVAALEGGPAPETSGADNLKSLAMVFGAIRSAETGSRVPIES